MCMYDDGDGWKFYASKMVTARKEHRCDECRRMIAPRERYRYTSGLGYDANVFSMFHQCEQCVAATRWLEVVCHGWMHDLVQDDLSEHVIGEESYVRSRPLIRLYRWMRADWRSRTGELRLVGDVVSLTTEAIEAYQRQFAEAVPG